jgi:putative hydrolase of the HAD superfamily
MIDPDIRAVFFDAVGTILFPRDPVWRTYGDCARRHGSPTTEEELRPKFHAAFARQELHDAQNGWRTDEDRERARWRAIVGEVLGEAVADVCFAELWAWFSTAGAWTVNRDADQIVKELAHRGIVVGLASNFDARLDGLVRTMPELTPFRGKCVISSRVGWRKPAAEFFDAVVAAAGCAPARILHVGDDVRNDVRGAAAAGIRAILYDPEERAGSEPRIRSLRDLQPR